MRYDRRNAHSARLPTIPQLHQTARALDDKTPVEASGITIEGKNKWIKLIQNASKNVKT